MADSKFSIRFWGAVLLIDKKSKTIFKNNQSFAEPFPKRFPKHLPIQKTFQMEFGITKTANSEKIYEGLRKQIGCGFESFSLSPWFENFNILISSIHDTFGNSKSRREPFHRGEEAVDDFSFEAGSWQSSGITTSPRHSKWDYREMDRGWWIGL